MSKLDEVVVSYRIFENSTEYLGVAQVTLPDIEFLTTTISGAGIAGEVEEVIKGHIKAMRTTINFNTYGDNALALTTPVDHTIDLREVQQARNMTAGKVELRKVKHIMTIKPVKVSIGKLETASPADANGEYTVSYYAQYVGGKKKIEIDPLNYRCWAVGDKKNTYSGGGQLYGKATNSNTISIEVCSTLAKGTNSEVPNHEGWSFTNAAIANAERLAKILMRRFSIPKERVVRHYDISGKLCPGVPGWNNGQLFTTEGKPTGRMSDSRKWEKFKKKL